jgi:glycosyltransferase involved in cell wall biosynthesis
MGGIEGEQWFDGVEVVPWSEEAEVGVLSEIDVGIMPLEDSAFARGKCALKAIQYMACWKPVIASPVGEATAVVRDGIEGILASSHEEWWAALSRLRGDRALGEAMGRAGRSRVEQRYSLAVAAPRLTGIVKAAAARGEVR